MAEDDEQTPGGSNATDDTDDTSGADVPEEQPIEQQLIPFMGDELAAAMTSGGTIYISFAGMCTALGLNVRGQAQRVQRTRSLRLALRRIPLETRGGLQRINCLRVDKLALWLAGVQTNQIKPRFREKIEAYQDELAPVAMQVFMRSLGIQPAPQPPTAPAVINAEIVEIRGQIETLYGVANLLQEHLAGLLPLPGQIADLNDQMGQALAMLAALAERQDTTETAVAHIDKRTQRLTPAHARAVQDEINRMVRDTKRLADPLTYTIIYGRLKHHWRVSTYKEVADEQYVAVMAYLQDELHRALAGEGPAQRSLF